MTTEPMAALVLDVRGLLWYSPEVQTDGLLLKMLRAQPVEAKSVGGSQLDCTRYELLSRLARYGPWDDQPIEVDPCALDAWLPLTAVLCVVRTEAGRWEEPRPPVWERMMTNVVEVMQRAEP